MRWRGRCSARFSGAKKDIDFFKRSKKSMKTREYFHGAWTPLMEITVAKLIRHGDHPATHRAVLVRSLRPGQAVLFIHPNSESHSDFNIERSNRAPLDVGQQVARSQSP